MLKVVSVSGFSDLSEQDVSVKTSEAVNARRGGFMRGTKVATTGGWKLVERLAAGDLVRTLDHGFKEVRRISTTWVIIPADETRTDFLPVFVPARVAYNGRPVWLMPEQGVAVDLGKIDPDMGGHSVVPARMFSGRGRLISQAPGSSFEVLSLFFDNDEVIFLEGGLQAYCPSGRFTNRADPEQVTYHVAEGEAASALVDTIAVRGDMSVLANPLGALPAPIQENPIFPIRPAVGMRRPGRPGRPNAPVLFLRREWQVRIG